MRFKGSFALPVGRWLLQVGSVLFGAYFVYVLLPTAPGAAADFFENKVFSALLLIPAVICLLRGFTATGSRRVWLAIGIGILFWWGGDLYSRLFFDGATARPVPSTADLLHLMFYPSVFVGIFALLRRLSDVPRTLWLQGVIAALAVAAIDAALVLETWKGASTTTSAAGLATQLAYPMADLVLLMLVVGGRAVAGGQLGRAWNWLTGALVLLAVADSLHLFQVTNGQYHAGGLIDVLWPGVMLLIAFAALDDDGVAERREINRRWLTLPSATFASMAALIVVLDHFRSFGLQTIAPAIGAIVVVIIDMALVQRDNLDLLERVREESFVDLVTGIPNRRALIRDLEYHCAEATREESAMMILLDLRGFKAYNDKFGHAAGDALLRRLGNNLLRAASGFGGAYRHSGDEFGVIAFGGPEQAQGIARVTSQALYERGEGFEISALAGIVMIPQESRDPVAILKLADQRLYAEKYKHTTVSPQQSAAMVKLAQSRPSNVGKYTRLIEATLRLAGSLKAMHNDEIENMIKGFQLRDIGNSAVPEAILNKDGKLTETEWQVVRSHTIVGERILNGIPSMRPVAEIVRHHHERFDGGGYPDGLAGDAIPEGARLVAIAQAFEGMTAERAFRAAMTFREAVAELGAQAGKQFDPRALAAFCQALDNTADASQKDAAAAASVSPKATVARPDMTPAGQRAESADFVRPAATPAPAAQPAAPPPSAPRVVPRMPAPEPKLAPVGASGRYIPPPPPAPAMFN